MKNAILNKRKVLTKDLKIKEFLTSIVLEKTKTKWNQTALSMTVRRRARILVTQIQGKNAKLQIKKPRRDLESVFLSF